jgi:hypothetical protein
MLTVLVLDRPMSSNSTPSAGQLGRGDTTMHAQRALGRYRSHQHAIPRTTALARTLTE